jgi:ADP-ribosyl-[dinitrogen reductase] hydrolase
MTLTTAQLDRAVGVLLGTAAGDALGAAYEFGPPRGPELEVAMVLFTATTRLMRL